ncbi:hypothetical protein [Halobellus inordinatus]|nr:hypothetical protein [Halobellus inordinatus]
MSRGADVSARLADVDAVCDFCGCFIKDDEQQCPARDEGRCQP